MSCLVAHGYFDEVGGFGSRTYRNNAMSDVLRADNSQTVKDAVGFVYVLFPLSLGSPSPAVFKISLYLTLPFAITTAETTG